MLEWFNKIILFHWLSYIAGKPTFVLISIVLLTVLIGARIPWLTFSTSVRSLVVDDVPERARYEEFKALFGSDEVIIVTVKGDDVFTSPFFKQLQTLSEKLGRIPGVNKVISLAQVKNSVDPQNHWSLQRFRKLVTPVKIFERYLISPDHRFSGITLILDEQADQEAISRTVDTFLARLPKGYQGYQIGMPSVSIALSRYTQQDFYRLPIFTNIVIALILMVFLRNVLEVAIPLLTVAVSGTWTMGIVAWSGLTMDMLTVVVPVLLIAVGTAYCLYVYCAFRDSIAICDDARTALLSTYSKTAYPTVIAVGTTAAGIISLMITPISAIRQFSGLACLGIFSLLVALLTFLPCLLVMVWPAMRKRQSHLADGIFPSRLVNKLVDLIVGHRRRIFWLLIIVSLFLLAGIFRIRVETNPLSYFKPSTPVYRHFHDIYRHLSGSFPLHLQVDAEEEDYFLTTSGIAELTNHQRFLESLPGVDKTLSIADYLMLINYMTHQFDPLYYRLPEADYETRMLVNQLKTILGHDLLNRYIGKAFANANITMLTRLHSARGFMATEKTVREYCEQQMRKGGFCHATGFGLVMSLGCRHLVNGQIYSLLVTLGIIFFLIHLMFFSMKIGAIAVVANLFPILVSFGAMGWLGIDLSMGTCLIASIVLGLAVDDTIHYLVHYKKAYALEMNATTAMRRTLTYIGRPIVATSVAISAGFSILMFSNFTPTAVFGLLVMLAMASSLSGGLVILPALLSKVSPITLEEVFKLRIGGIELQQKVPLLKGMTRSQVHRILNAGVIHRVDSGLYLFEQGDAADNMYVVISGVFDALMTGPDVDSEHSKSLPKRVNRLGVGDVIGEMGVITSGARCVSVVAVASGEVLALSQKHLKRIRLQYPRTAGRLLANLSVVLTEKLIAADRSLYLSCSLDEDTGMLNREAFLNSLDNEIRRALRFNAPMSLCLLEFDDIGNEFGASPLDAERFFCEMAATVSDSFRKIDIVGRLDRSTVAVILVRTMASSIDDILGRLKSRLKKQKTLYTSMKTSISYQIMDLNSLLPSDDSALPADPAEIIHFRRHQIERHLLYENLPSVSMDFLKN